MMDAVAAVTLTATAIGLVAGCVQVADYWERKRQEKRKAAVPLAPPAAPPQTQPSAPSNLPAQTTSFIGREEETAELLRLMTTDDAARLVTLTGTGGCGKTRLALRAAEAARPAFPGGVRWCDLSALRDAAQVAPSVAAACGVTPEGPETATEALCRCLASRRALLLLDNCEHLLDGVCVLVETLLHSCPTIRILGTSREDLGVSGEQVYPLSPLSVPDALLPATSRNVETSAAARLFVERARAEGGRFVLSDGNADAVARICRRLDGLPLAIELVGARARSLSPEQIAGRLENPFPLLTGGARTAPPRQQTLRAAVDWSFNLLSEGEQRLFRQVGVFAGGWTLEAAEAVCGGPDVLDILSELVDQSLVTADTDSTDGTPRFRLLETLRAYSLERPPEDADAVRVRHREFYAALAEKAEPHLRGPQQAAWLRVLETEHDNLRAALLSSDTAGRLCLGTRLHKFWLARGFVSEGRGYLDGALSAPDAAYVDPAVRAAALGAAGVLAWAAADLDAAEARQAEALSLWRALGNDAGVALALKQAAIVADYRDDYDAARAGYDESLALFRQLGDTTNVASVLVNMGAHFLDRGLPDAAVPVLEESLALRRVLGDAAGEAVVLHDLGQGALARGDAADADRLFSQSLALRRDAGDRRGVAQSLLHLSLSAQAGGQHERAAHLLGAADTAHGDAPRHAFILQHQEELTGRLVNALGKARFERICAEGRAMPPDAAIIFALRESSSS